MKNVSPEDDLQFEVKLDDAEWVSDDNSDLVVHVLVSVDVVAHQFSSHQIDAATELVTVFIKGLFNLNQTFSVNPEEQDGAAPLTPVFYQVKHHFPKF